MSQCAVFSQASLIKKEDVKLFKKINKEENLNEKKF
jgi:hypothetical protein